MEIYLTIITTVLVLTQIIRLIQNAVQLRRQNVLFKKQLGQIKDVTNEDIDRQRKAYSLIIKYLEHRVQEKADLPRITDQTMNAIKKMGEKAHGGE